MASWASTSAVDEGVPIIVGYMKRLRRIHPPGTHYDYNFGETTLIGILIRRAIDQSLATYLAEKIWQPFGMEDDANWFLNDDGEERAGGGLTAATKDYARFGLFVLE